MIGHLPGQGRPLSPRADLVLGWAMIAVAALVTFLLRYDAWPIDLTALYFAGHFYGLGQPELTYLLTPNVLQFTPPPEWAALAAAEGMPPGTDLTAYVYPPLWLIPLGWIGTHMSAIGFFNLMLVLNIASVGGMIWLGWRLLRPAGLGFAGWTALALLLTASSVVGVLSFWLGQPQIFIFFLVLAAFAALAEGRELSAGSLLALAAAIKLTPALLALIFIMERRWRALGAFLAVGLGFAALSLLAMGWPLHRVFLDKLGDLDAVVITSRIVVGLEFMLYQAGNLLAGAPAWQFGYPDLVPEPGWISWLVRAALIAGLALSWWASAGLDSRRRIWARLMALLLLSLITNPLPWIHYLLLPLLLFPGFVAFLPPSQVLRFALGVAFALAFPVFLLLSQFDRLLALQSLLYFAVTLALLVAVLVLSRRAARG